MQGEETEYKRICAKFAKSFKVLKRTRNIKHADIRKALGFSYETLWHWDNKSHLPRAIELVALSKHFGISIDELLGLTKKEK